MKHPLSSKIRPSQSNVVPAEADESLWSEPRFREDATDTQLFDSAPARRLAAADMFLPVRRFGIRELAVASWKKQHFSRSSVPLAPRCAALQ